MVHLSEFITNQWVYCISTLWSLGWCIPSVVGKYACPLLSFGVGTRVLFPIYRIVSDINYGRSNPFPLGIEFGHT
jgi:hypothetical protein